MPRNKKKARKNSAIQPKGKVGKNEPKQKKQRQEEEEAPSLVLMEPTMQWLLSPITPEDFFANYWEKKPLLIKRKDRTYYNGLFSLDELFQVTTERELVYGNNINVSIFQDGWKINRNPTGEVAEVKDLKQFWKEGCTFQVLHPQQYSDSMWRICSMMEDKFGCLVGANSYLTPPNSQGLAPHWDDVEVFILQLEGKKHWVLHNPPMSLPRDYSKDMHPDTLPEKPIMEVDLEPGDFLYFPRGTIHFARTSETQLSTHMTVSTYQTTTWFDFMQRALPVALEKAFSKEEELRKGLPVNLFSFMGNPHNYSQLPSSLSMSKEKKQAIGKTAEQQKKFVEHFKALLKKLETVVEETVLHEAVSDLALDFVANRIPPVSAVATEGGDFDDSGPYVVVDSPMPASDEALIRLKNPDWIQLIKSKDEEEPPGIFEGGESEGEGGEGEEGFDMDDGGEGSAEGPEEEEEEKPKKGKGKGKAKKEEKQQPKEEKGGKGKGKERQKKQVSEEEEEEEDEDDEEGMEGMEGFEGEGEGGEEEESIVLFHCLRNRREHHMDGQYMQEGANPACLKFPVAYEPALVYLVSQFPDFVPLGSLPGIDDPKSRFGLAVGLWSEGLLETRAPSSD